MSLETATFAPGSINSSTKDTREECVATASVCQLTEKERREFDAAEALRIGQIHDRRLTWDLTDYVESRVNDQKKLVGKTDMPKYLKYEQETKTMTREARECFDPNFECSLAEEMVGAPGTENTFRMSTRIGICCEIKRRGHLALEQLTKFKTSAKEWDKPWDDENDESILYYKHLTAKEKVWAAADALASTTVRAAGSNSKTETEVCQVRGNSRSQEKSSQEPSIDDSGKDGQITAADIPDTGTSKNPSRCLPQTATRKHEDYISECQKQSEATTNLAYKNNYKMTARCLTKYNNKLQSKEPADIDGKGFSRAATAKKYSRWINIAGVMCPSIRDRHMSETQVQDNCPSDLGCEDR